MSKQNVRDTPFTLLGVSQEHPAAQLQHECRGPSSDPCRLHYCCFSLCEPPMIPAQQIPCIMFSWFPYGVNHKHNHVKKALFSNKSCLGNYSQEKACYVLHFL